jgi:hypothetical protein
MTAQPTEDPADPLVILRACPETGPVADDRI